MSGAELEAVVPTPDGVDRIVKAGTDLDRVARLGMWLAAAESKSTDPKAKGMAAALRIAYAESLGLPAHAASEIHVINGNLATSAQLKRAQAFSHGFQILPTEQTEDTCTVEIVDRKTGAKVGLPVTFTLADAKRMGLLDKPGKAWHQNPADMLFARASSKAIRMYIPHVALGVMTLEEAEDLPFVEAEVVTEEDVPFGDPD
jgi:hypothetical protein